MPSRSNSILLAADACSARATTNETMQAKNFMPEVYRRGADSMTIRWLMIFCVLSFSAVEAPGQDRGPGEFALPADFFPIMPWELTGRSKHFPDDHHGLASLADCGFNTAAF